MITRETATGIFDLIENTTINPDGTKDGSIDSNSLFTKGLVVITPVRFDEVMKQSRAVPRRFAFREFEGFLVGSGKFHHDFMRSFRVDADELIIFRNSGVDGVNSGLYSGDTDGKIGEVKVDEIGQTERAGGGSGKS